jgi:ABC-2 type transport system ATP-binding protein
VFGLDPTRDRRALREVLGAQLQAAELPERLRVEEALRLYASFYRRPAEPAELLDAVGLTAQRRVAYGSLSGGQKRRLSIALAFVGQPRAAVLDELTTGLDPVGRRDVWELIVRLRGRGLAILLVTHDLEEAEHLCDRIAFISGGRLVALDTPAGFVERVGLGQRVRFRPSSPLPAPLLDALERLGEVGRVRDEVVVAGRGDVAQAVLGLLSQHGVRPDRLSVDRGALDEAYLALSAARFAKGVNAQ